MQGYRVLIAVVLFSAASVTLIIAEGSPTDPGCQDCLQSDQVQKWMNACQKANDQAACHCAGGALIQCVIDKGGCGGDIMELKKKMNEAVANAKALGTTCF
jgi:hypothetical protein